MSIICFSEIMKIIDERKTHTIKTKKQTNKQTNKDRKDQRGTKTTAKVWELNDFVAHLS